MRSCATLRRVVAVGVVWAASQATASAQGPWRLEDRGYYEPLIGEVRAATMKIMFAGWSDEFPFMQRPGRRFIWDVSVGKEIPLFGFETGDGEGGPLGSERWGVGVWMPVSFHMVEDFKDPSNPIVNTDYRFSGMLKSQYGWTDTLQVGGRFQAGHESTHLGDEFTIAAERSDPAFERVNVSYEYWEFGVTVEWQTDATPSHEFIVRGGGIGLFDSGQGFYGDTLLVPDGKAIARSQRNYESTAGFEWKMDGVLDSGAALLGNLWPFVSLDLRHRTHYDYARPTDDTREGKQWSFNLLLGLRRAERRFQQKGLPELYVRFYHGVNPHGQFRNQRSYTLIGVGLHVPV